MKRSLATFLGLILITNLLSFALAPTAIADEEIGDLIRDQLEPIEDVYGQDDVDSGTFARAIADIIKIVLGFLGIIFLVLILYAGFSWMTSGGNEEKISKAKKIMTAAVVGAAIVLAAYAITFFVVDALLEATGSGQLD